MAYEFAELAYIGFPYSQYFSPITPANILTEQFSLNQKTLG